MFKNLEKKETNQEAKKSTYKNLEINNIIDERCNQLEKKMNQITRCVIIKDVHIWDQVKQLEKQNLGLFQIVDELSSKLTALQKKYSELFQLFDDLSPQSNLFSNAKCKRKNNKIISLTYSDSEVNIEDIGETDSTGSEDELMQESSVKMLSGRIVKMDLEMNKKDENLNKI